MGKRINKNGVDTFNVSLIFDCELLIQRNKLTDFSLGLWLEIEAVPNVKTLDFKVKSHQQFVTFYPYG